MATVTACSVATPSTLATRQATQLKSSFTSSFALSTPKAVVAKRASTKVTAFKRDWLRTDLSVIGFGLVGWLAPSSIPAINGESLTGLFFSSIGPELAKFPVGPSVDSPFWLWLVLWHLGLFITLTFGQVGVKGRKDGLYD